MIGKKCVLKVNLDFSLTTPLIIKSESNEDYIDAKIDRTPDGKLYINGYVWASLFRRAAKRLKKVPHLFHKLGNYEGKEGVSLFWFEGSSVDLVITDIRPGLNIHRRYGSALDGALYFEEIVPCGMRIPLSFKVFADEFNELESVLKTLQEAIYIIDSGIENIGGNWSYGLGRLKFVSGTYQMLDLSRDSDLELLAEDKILKNSFHPQAGKVQQVWIKYKVKARIEKGQLLAIHSELPPLDLTNQKAKLLPEEPDHYVFRSFVLEDGSPKQKFVLPGKIIRQALFSQHIERKLRTQGEHVCSLRGDKCTCAICEQARLEKPKLKKAPDCQCKICRWFGSTDSRGIIAVTDAVIKNASTVDLRRIQLCEHSMQNINLFFEEYLTQGNFEFEILIDQPKDNQELLENVEQVLEEMTAQNAPPGWYRLGNSTTCAGSIRVLEWNKEQVQEEENA
ncbi:MAG: RAMP superfamily CRISPR-associated protein [Desulfonauticus sp.]|nr:RAMP superfamily CRISPR-associated protein [Desulfonauticus sp.]